MFFKTFEFDFETRRLMWYCPYGGSDFAEVSTTAEKIKERDYESWYTEWKEIGDLLTSRFYISDISKGKAFLRASRYYQAAEFFLHPTDSRKLEVYNNSVEYFYRGLDLLQIPYQMKNIHFKEVTLRTLSFRTTKKCKGTLLICSGFDGLLEELYFTNVKAALDEGYNCILFEGPGQSHVIRYQHKAFIPNWDTVVSQVVDAYKDEIVSPKIGIGLSLGGLLMARTSNLNPQVLDKVVLYNYFPSLLDSFKTSIPKFLHRYLETGFPVAIENIVSFYIKKVPFLNWQIENAKWVFGKSSLNELIRYCREFEELPVNNPVLVCVSKKDNYYDSSFGIEYYHSLSIKEKRLVVFDKEKYFSELHCQNGASFVTNDVIFEWLNDC